MMGKEELTQGENERFKEEASHIYKKHVRKKKEEIMKRYFKKEIYNNKDLKNLKRKLRCIL